MESNDFVFTHREKKKDLFHLHLSNKNNMDLSALLLWDKPLTELDRQEFIRNLDHLDLENILLE